MSFDIKSELADWKKSLISTAKKIQMNVKKIEELSADPFTVRKQIKKVTSLLQDLGLSNLVPPLEILEKLDEDCLIQEAEFWGRLKEAVLKEGWEILGTTNRRLLNRGIFIEQEGDQVQVEGVVGKISLHVPTLIESIRSEVKGLIPSDNKELRRIIQGVISAYEMAGGRGEVEIEKVYRLTILQLQKPIFWSEMRTSSFQRFSRPMFRALISRLLSERGLLAPHLTLRLGTTVDPKHAWEVFSPGEARVVQVGRLSIASQGG